MIEITEAVCKEFNIPYASLFTNSRKRNIIDAKVVAIYIIRKTTTLSTPKIGVFFNRGHDTILHSIKSVTNRMDVYPEYRNKVNAILLGFEQRNQKTKIVYIAHPISGDVQGNIEKILKIVQKINLTEDKIVPFAPYITDVMALDDNEPDQRARGINNNRVYFQSGIIDEVRVYGDFISVGVAEEIALARQLDIPVEYYNPNLS